ncbi:MAG: squalene--hopene cyclase [Chloroflexi bacterium]|nr:squalene--hopene cyclase [Chloroflexota bacterium]
MVAAKSQGAPPGTVAALDQAVQRAVDYFLRTQHPDGYWWGELESNPTMEAEYLLLTHFLGAADRGQWPKLANYILSKQREDGGWGQYYGAPSGDLSTSVECYFALKLAGVSPQSQALRRAREFILSKGGVPRVRTFTKVWLALFGQWGWRALPVLPPELMFLPTWSPINIYEFGSWARATIVPMSIILARRPVCPVPTWAAIDELYPVPRSQVPQGVPAPKPFLGWAGFFWALDWCLRQYDRSPWKPGRGWAIELAEVWTVRHQEADGSWGGIQPPWVYALIALKTLGYPLDHPVMARGLQGFQGFAIEEGDTLRVQACLSPLWDTCLAMMALEDAGLPPDHPALQKAAQWLLQKQSRRDGDWRVKNAHGPAAGWAFEFANEWYPDLDDTAEVVMALHRVQLPDEEAKREALDLSVSWLLSMQCRNGGWASFDKDNTRKVLTKVPFCDFGEVIDPPTEDVTAHVVEMLGRLGYAREHPAAARALRYLWSQQEEDGPWFGRWGVNYVYGSGAVLPALEAIGEDMRQPAVHRAVAWLLGHQNEDGGWGEVCGSYVDPSLRGRGPSTASQTAWALLALMAAGEWRHPAVARGVSYLVTTQREDGTWDEPWFTGTGFPGYGVGQRVRRLPQPGERGYQGTELPAAFMINYHLYRDYWPLMALGRYQGYLDGRLQRSTDNWRSRSGAGRDEAGSGARGPDQPGAEVKE